jgi:hypothetical protein
MANPLPNEKELYEQIKKEEISIEPGIWDLLYQRIGDDITAINLLCQYYLTNQEPIPAAEAEKIIVYTKDIKDIVNKLTVVSKESYPFPQFKDTIPLHPIIREMFTHYIGNDVYVINLMVRDQVDPLDPQPIPPETAKKIVARIRTTKEFIERLREATCRS